MKTERGKFWIDNADAVARAAEVISKELASRHINVHTSTCRLIAMHACAAFAGVPETPAAVQLENIRTALAEQD